MELSNRNDNGNRVQISEVLESLHKCNEIKYASYRMASKVKILQKALRTDILTLNVISGVFDRHRFYSSENKLQLNLSNLEHLLSDIFFASNKLGEHCIDVEACVCLTIQFLERVFVLNKSETVNALSIKILLCVLSSDTFENKCHFMFKQSADHNLSVTRLNFKAMLWPLAKLGDFLEEGLWFGTHLILAVVNDCFVTWPGHFGLIESAFNDWLSTNPDWFSWLHILQKFNLYEGHILQYICSSCKKSPIEGLAFKCRKCKNYFQCLNCFSRAVYSNTHRPSHKMEEIHNTIQKKRGKKYVESNICSLYDLINCFKKSRTDNTNLRSSNSSQLNIVTKSDCVLNSKSSNEDELNQISNVITKTNSSKTTSEINKKTSVLHKRLQSVISQLEVQMSEMHKRIIPDFNILPDADKHFNLLEAQFNILKEIREALKTSMVNSTPLPNTTNRSVSMDLELLSPIPLDKKDKKLSFEDSCFDSMKLTNSEQSTNNKEATRNTLNIDENCFITVQSYVEKHLNDEEKFEKLNYRNKAQISSFSYNETDDETYTSNDESNQKSYNVDTTGSSKADINFLIKKLHDILNVSDCDNTELSRSASKLESCLSNIIDSLEIDMCLQKLKLSEKEFSNNSPGTSTEVL